MGTQNELAERYGPQTTQIEALLERARNLSDEEAEALSAAAQDAARDATWDTWVTRRAAARDAAWDASRDADRQAWVARVARDARDARGAAREAVLVLVVRDLIGQHGFTQRHYDTLVALWESVMGTEWTRETL